MIEDKVFNTVYFSDYLRHPLSINDQGLSQIYKDLDAILMSHHYQSRLIPYKYGRVPEGQLSIWCRDYMPIQVSEGRMMAFSYTPDYLKTKQWIGHEPDCNWALTQIDSSLAYINESTTTSLNIILDGGNIVRCGGLVVMTDKVFSENPDKKPSFIKDTLEKYFNAEIIFLPWDHRETYGHTDGILRYLGNDTIVMPTYGNPSKNKKDREFYDSFMKILSRKFEILPMDFSDIEEPKINGKDHRWAYINWLQLDGLIILPVFANTPESNMKAVQLIKDYTVNMNIDVECVEATALVNYGGGLNCASWTTKE